MAWSWPATTAGLVGDLQVLHRYLKAEVELYKLKRGSPMNVEACATLCANILSSRRYFPYWVHLIIGGTDAKGGHVFSLDAAGGCLPDKFTTSGSGSPYVFGVLEDHFKEGLTISDGVDLAVRAVTAAMKRDAASGDGLDVVTITKAGYEKLSDEEIKRRKEKLNLT